MRDFDVSHRLSIGDRSISFSFDVRDRAATLSAYIGTHYDPVARVFVHVGTSVELFASLLRREIVNHWSARAARAGKGE